MELEFVVHGVSTEQVPVRASVAGEEMTVNTHGLVVELVGKDPLHGALTLRFIKNLDEWKKKLVVDSVVTLKVV